MTSSFDEPNVAGAWSLLRIFRCELYTLSLAQQLEHGTADGTAVEKMFNPAFVADEPEPLVDEEPCDCPGWHNPKPFRSEPPGNIPRVLSRCGRLRRIPSRRDASPAESVQRLLSWKIGASLATFSPGSQAETSL